MVAFSTLVGVFASAAMAAAVPIQDRTYEPMAQDQSKDMSKDMSSQDMSKDMGMDMSKDMSMGMSKDMGMQSEAMDMMTESMAMDMMTESKAMDMMTESKAMETSTAMAMETSSAMAMETSSAMAMETSSPMYGSGSMDKSGYNDCVSQCMAKFGGGSASMYQAQSTGETAGSMGGGATHTVVVAPAQGVLRYVPPFVDASVGDTVLFKWGANNHTVTKSSQLTPCNKTADALFASGTQNKDFTFTQKVNDTNATFFYCATPGHCPKGMFGIINFNKADSSSNNSAAMMMQSMNASMSAETSKYMSYTSQMTANNSMAAKWGENMDMSSIPSWAQEPMMQNIMYMRNVIAMNPDIMDASGSVNMGASSAPMMLPNDVNLAATTNGGSSSSAGSATGAAAPAASSSSAATPAGAAQQPNGAGSVTVSKAVMGAAVVFATYFLL